MANIGPSRFKHVHRKQAQAGKGGTDEPCAAMARAQRARGRTRMRSPSTTARIVDGRGWGAQHPGAGQRMGQRLVES